MAWLSLTASLAMHASVVGGFVLSSRLGGPDLFAGEGGPGAGGSGSALIVSLVEVPGQTGADTPLHAPAAVLPSALPPAERPKSARPRPDSRAPAPAIAAAPHARVELGPRLLPSPDSAPRIAAALTDTTPPPPSLEPAAAEAGAAFQAAGVAVSRGAESDAGALAGAGSGSGSGYGTGPLDRVAKPAGSIRPHYPPRARQRGEEADVAVEVWVGAGGEVDRIAVADSAGAEFDAAAIAAVQRARFHPALRDGEGVPSRVALLLHFRLEQ